VRIEFCEADVLDAFDAWRRAVGMAQPTDEGQRPRATLGSHVERATARLTAMRASSEHARAFDSILDDLVRALDGLLPRARSARGHAREELIAELAALDRRLIDGVVQALPDADKARAEAAAVEQLAPFRERMGDEAYESAYTAAMEQIVRDQFRLPRVAFE
jgi:hypothetical protein